MKLYYCIEDNNVYSTDDIREEWQESIADGNTFMTDTFSDYLTNCMWYNNGSLYDITDRIRELKREINRKEVIGQKYGMEYVDDELQNLRAELSELNGLYMAV